VGFGVGGVGGGGVWGGVWGGLGGGHPDYLSPRGE